MEARQRPVRTILYLLRYKNSQESVLYKKSSRNNAFSMDFSWNMSKHFKTASSGIGYDAVSIEQQTQDAASEYDGDWPDLEPEGGDDGCTEKNPASPVDEIFGDKLEVRCSACP